MDEQRALAEIERRLSAEDPRLAARLSSFRTPGPAGRLRSPRVRILGSLFAVAVVAVISMMVYAMVPFRAHGAKTGTSPQASTSAPVHSGPAPGASANSSAASSSATGTNATGGSAAVNASTAPKIHTPISATGPRTSTGRKTPGTSKTAAVGEPRTNLSAMFVAK
jgi:hypothetical protein